MALKALNRWKSGETGALLITGDPGMGKSHFVEQVLDSMLGRECHPC
jgi:nucleoside-triphosphatase THEP1